MSQEPSTVRSSRTVLVADDDDTMRRIIRGTLEKDGWVVEEADNGAHACSAVERHQPAVVLLDVEMPELNGFDTCRKLRAMAAGDQLPILMVTGQDDPQSIENAYAAGATDFLPKPFDYTVLRQRVQYMYRASQAMGDLRSERDFVSAMVDTSAALVMSLDRNGRILRLNPSCEHVSGYPFHDVQHKFVWDIFSCKDERDRERRLFEQLVSEMDTRSYDGSWTAIDGTRREITWSNSVVVNAGGEVEKVVYTGLDLTERNQAQDEVHFLESYDRLTGLPNRRLMLERVGQAIAAADANGQQLAVLLLDLDNFTRFNATFGHAVGDLLLQQVTERFSKSIRLSNVLGQHSHLRTELGRVGGDEFTALLSGVSEVGEVAGVIERLQGGLSRPFRFEEQKYTVTASVGATLYPSDGTDAEGLLGNAESAMRAAREQRREGYHFYSSTLHTQVAGRLSLEAELRQAIERGELVLHYQPKVRVTTGSLVGAEALLRWQHPTRGLIPPAAFINLAEESGVIVSIGEWVLREVCAQVASWLESGLRPVPLTVNLSAAQVRFEDLFEQVVAILNETGVDSCYLGVEVTERMIMRDASEAREILASLKELGVRVAIDDFGTGYSALSTLKTLEVDDLKIGRAFVKSLAECEQDVVIAKAIITMAHALGLTVVAEGVESEEELTILRQQGCDEVQGFLVSVAVPGEQFTTMLQDRNLASSSPAFSHSEPREAGNLELCASGGNTVRDADREPA